MQSSEEVPLSWHPRKQNCVKTYEYKILNRRINLPTLRLYTYFSYYDLNVERMLEAAAYLVGEHDFRSFCTVRRKDEDTVRTIYSLTVDRAPDDVITIRVSGSGFLYNMVRIIAGTLIQVGTGALEPEQMRQILAARDRKQAGPTAPAKGLTLVSMEYERELRPEICGTNEEWEYVLDQREVPLAGMARLTVNRCLPEYLEPLMARVIHQAVRNGAEIVLVRDLEDRLAAGQRYGYYVLREAETGDNGAWRLMAEKTPKIQENP